MIGASIVLASAFADGRYACAAFGALATFLAGAAAADAWPALRAQRIKLDHMQMAIGGGGTVGCCGC